MRGVNEDNASTWVSMYVGDAQAHLGREPLTLAQIAFMGVPSVGVGKAMFEVSGMWKRVSRYDRDKALAYVSLSIFAGNEAATELGQDVPAVFTEALRLMREDLSSRTLNVLDAGGVAARATASRAGADSTPVSASQPNEVESRLNGVEDLRQRGVITEDEYVVKRREILDTL